MARSRKGDDETDKKHLQCFEDYKCGESPGLEEKEEEELLDTDIDLLNGEDYIGGEGAEHAKK